MSWTLTEYDHLPEDFWSLSSNEAYKIFPGTSIVHLKGEKKPPIFISTLLHGNETTSWIAVQRWLAKYKDQALPRSVSLLIGNVEAAKDGVRRLHNQEDFNRIWSEGTSNGNLLAQNIYNVMEKKGVFVNVDIHNNTGKNPHYACISELDDRFIYLAKSFSQSLVYFKRPKECQSTYFSQLCPSLTLESGKVGDQAGIEHVIQFLEFCMHIEEFPEKVAEDEFNIFHSVAGLLVPRGVSINFVDHCDAKTDVCLLEKFEELNFQELPENFLLGKTKVEHPLVVVDEHNNDVTGEFLKIENNEIRLRRSMIPAMLTQDLRVIQQDCLGYLMQRFVRG